MMLSIFSCVSQPSVYLVWRNVCLVLWLIFLFGTFIFLVLSCMSCLYIFEINSLSVASFAIIFSHSESCLFILLIVSFAVFYGISISFFFFKAISTLFSIVAILVFVPTNSVLGFPFLCTLSSIYCLQTF